MASNASLRKADQTQGGGARQATITEIAFVDDFDYGGRQSKAQAALKVVFEIDGFQKPWDQHCTVGPAEAWEVTDDGYGIARSSGKAGGLNDSSNAGRFLGAAEDAAVAGSLDLDDVFVDNTVRALEGARVNIEKLKYETVGGDEKEMFVIESFIELGGTSKKAKKGGGTKAGGNVESDTETVVLALLDDKSPLKKADLPTLVASAAKKNPNARAMTQLVLKDAFLFSEDRPWDSDKKKGTIKVRENDEDDE